MFLVLASVYVLSAIGMPVYFHYCGGELEKVDLLTKSDSCCGDEEQDPAEGDNGCCKDEEVYVQNNEQAILKGYKSFIQTPFLLLSDVPRFFTSILPKITASSSGVNCLLAIHHSRFISTFMLRI